ncbi:MAG TPA: hypothetical protein V6C97_21470 [Oculatellaceae cyanobacterium]
MHLTLPSSTTAPSLLHVAPVCMCPLCVYMYCVCVRCVCVCVCVCLHL